MIWQLEDSEDGFASPVITSTHLGNVACGSNSQLIRETFGGKRFAVLRNVLYQVQLGETKNKYQTYVITEGAQ